MLVSNCFWPSSLKEGVGLQLCIPRPTPPLAASHLESPFPLAGDLRVRQQQTFSGPRSGCYTFYQRRFEMAGVTLILNEIATEVGSDGSSGKKDCWSWQELWVCFISPLFFSPHLLNLCFIKDHITVNSREIISVLGSLSCSWQNRKLCGACHKWWYTAGSGFEGGIRLFQIHKMWCVL